MTMYMHHKELSTRWEYNTKVVKKNPSCGRLHMRTDVPTVSITEVDSRLTSYTGTVVSSAL